jgi:hypothetical protein
MGLPVTVYRWDDAGAPQLTNQKPSELINILNKCLVTGYGSKAGLGWTKPFENVATNSVMFRNNVADGGSGGIVKFNSVTGGDSSREWLRMTSAQDATSITASINAGRQDMIGAPDSDYDGWIIVGTSTACIVIFCKITDPMVSTSSLPDSSAYIGDFENYLPADAGRFIALGYTGYSGDYTSSGSTAYSYTLSSLSRSTDDDYANTKSLKLVHADSTVGNELYGIIAWLNFDSTANAGIGSGTTPINIFLPYIICAGRRVTDTALDPDGKLYRYSVKSPTIRGCLKGITYEVIPRYTPTDVTWPHFETVNGKLQMLMRTTSQAPNTWINLEAW